MKKCNKCGVIKPLVEFHKNKASRDGHVNDCKECACAKARAWHADNRERAADHKRLYREVNSELVREQDRASYARNAESAKARSKAWSEVNKERVRDNKRKYVQAHYEEHLECGRAWRENNRDKDNEVHRASKKRNAEQVKAYNRAYNKANRERLRERMAKDRKENPERWRGYANMRRENARKGMTKEDVSLTFEYRKAIADDPCYYCGKRSVQMHDDHMMPVSRGGTDHWWNLVRACSRCNLRKSSMTAEEFITRLIEEEE